MDVIARTLTIDRTIEKKFYVERKEYTIPGENTDNETVPKPIGILPGQRKNVIHVTPPTPDPPIDGSPDQQGIYDVKQIISSNTPYNSGDEVDGVYEAMDQRDTAEETDGFTSDTTATTGSRIRKVSIKSTASMSTRKTLSLQPQQKMKKRVLPKYVSELSKKGTNR